MADQSKAGRGAKKSANAFRTISEVAAELNLPQHVLRFWESKFSQIKPMKRGGGRRYYRPEDLEVLQRIRTLLYEDGYTIKGVQKLFKEGGITATAGPRSIDAAAQDTQSSLVKENKLDKMRGVLEDLKDIRNLI